MKAILMTETGGPDVLKLMDIPEPVIQREREILVKLRAAGVNPVDAKQRRRGTWYSGTLPAILGIDGAGVVEEVAGGVKRFKVGDEVYFANGGIGKDPGNYAEYTVVDERFVALKPESLSFVEAAAAPAALITAWESLFDRGGVERGQWVLIHAGAGGVGHIALQLAREEGAKICTTVSTDVKADIARKFGAEKVILYRKSDFVKETLEWTDGRGVDVAIDLVGGETFFRTLGCVRFYGNVVTLLGPESRYANWREARLRNIRITYELMLTPMYYELEILRKHQTEILEKCTRKIDDSRLSVLVSKTFPLRDAEKAHRMIEKGGMTGKIVLIVE